MRIVIGLSVVLLMACGGTVEESPAVMNAGDALALPRPEPDARLIYGDDPLHFGELRLPGGDGPFPVAVVIHGGCWLAEYDLGYISGLAGALRDAGVATWSVEYRRVGDEGGGWPGTFEDVAYAADALIGLAPEYDLDLDRVVAVGHSAGGHLALWLAGRESLHAEDPFRGRGPLPLNGVVALAGIPDLTAYASPVGCGAAVTELLGGEPLDLPERTGRASPFEMLPFGVPQILVIGELDTIVPASQAREYLEVAQWAGDSVRVVEIPGAGHFELVDPSHAAFETVREAVLEVLEAQWTE